MVQIIISVRLPTGTWSIYDTKIFQDVVELQSVVQNRGVGKSCYLLAWKDKRKEQSPIPRRKMLGEEVNLRAPAVKEPWREEGRRITVLTTTSHLLLVLPTDQTQLEARGQGEPPI